MTSEQRSNRERYLPEEDRPSEPGQGQSVSKQAAMQTQSGQSARRLQGQAPGSAQPRFVAKHTVVAGETLSHLALKYYGSAIKEKWMAIYNANQDVIGPDPNRIRVGQVLNIPEVEE